ncbi:MAG: S8 family peptidase [Methylococcus sp.]
METFFNLRDSTLMPASKLPLIVRILVTTLILIGVATETSAGMVPDLLVMLQKDVDTASPHPIDTALLKQLELIAGVPMISVGQTRTHAQILSITGWVTLEQAEAAAHRLSQLEGVLWATLEAQPARKPAVQSLTPEPAVILEFLVKLKDDRLALSPDNNLLEKLSATIGQRLTFSRNTTVGRVLTLNKAITQSQARIIEQQLESLSEVLYADPLQWAKKNTIVPNDPDFYGQWHLYDAVTSAGGANVQSAWNITKGTSNIGVAIIDTGALFSHPDLERALGSNRPRMKERGWDLISDPTNARDGDGRDPYAGDEGDWTPAVCLGSINTDTSPSSWHGSHMTGIVAATTNNHQGVAGINFKARVVPVRVLGACGGSFDDVNDGIYWAAGSKDVPGTKPNLQKVKVLSMSLGADVPCSDSDQAAIDYALSRGITVVVAGGNRSIDMTLSTPAGCRGVIAVSAVGPTGDLAYYSSFGKIVSIASPGGQTRWNVMNEAGTVIDSKHILPFGIYAPVNLSLERPDPKAMGYAWYQGTSIATPVVSGIVSLMLSLDRHHRLTPAKIKNIIQGTARPFPLTTIQLVKNTGTQVVEEKEVPSSCQTSLKGLCGPGIIDAEEALKAVLDMER